MSSSKGAQFSLVSAIIFALVAIGFSAFILFWKGPEKDVAAPAPKILTAQEKEASMESLRQNAPPPMIPANLNPPSESQADPNDANAAAKLQILKSLNAN